MDRLAELYIRAKERSLPKWQHHFHEKPHDFDRLCLPAVWADHERVAMYHLVIGKDSLAAKQEFHTCGTLTTYGVLRFGYWPKDRKAEYFSPNVKVEYMGFLNHISYLLLSDCEALIQQYSTLHHQWWEEKTKDGLMIYALAIQCVLHDDWKGLERHLVQFDRRNKRDRRIQYDKDFFIGIMERNMDKVKRSIETLCEKRFNRNDPFLPHLMSVPAAGYAKLAWLKGMQVQIDSPLVPMELMPIAPLEHYVNPYERFWRLGEN